MAPGEVPEAPPRTRRNKFAPKSRTGCSGCRKAKVKCDEIKPSCSRCTRNHYTCEYIPVKTWLFQPKRNENVSSSSCSTNEEDGRVENPRPSGNIGSRLTSSSSCFINDITYSCTTSTITVRRQHVPLPLRRISTAQRDCPVTNQFSRTSGLKPLYQVSRSIPLTYHDVESTRSIQYFLEKLCAVITSYGDPYLFEVVIPQRVWHEPAIKHSLVAAAMAGESVLEHKGDSAARRAAYHYQKAVSSLARSKPTTDTVLMACGLLLFYERYNGNVQAFVLHHESAAKILMEWRANGAGQHTAVDETIKRYLEPLYMEGFRQATSNTVTNTPAIREYLSLDATHQAPVNPAPFIDQVELTFEQIADNLVDHINLLMGANPKLKLDANFPRHYRLLKEWRSLFDQSSRISSTSRDERSLSRYIM